MWWSVAKNSLGVFVPSLAAGVAVAKYHGAENAGDQILALAALASLCSAIRSWFFLRKVAQLKVKDRRHLRQLQRVSDAMALQRLADFSIFLSANNVLSKNPGEAFSFTTIAGSSNHKVLKLMELAELVAAPVERALADKVILLDFELNSLGKALLNDLTSAAMTRRVYLKDLAPPDEFPVGEASRSA